jgi:hypothetical protein
MPEFKISRYGTDHPRVVGCVYKPVDRIEVRKLPTAEAFDEKFGKNEGAWLSKGSDHGLTADGCIMRRHKDADFAFFINLNTFEELLQLIESHGPVKIEDGEIIINCGDYY